MSAEDAEELDVLIYRILLAAQNNSALGLMDVYQRLKHISARTQGLFEDN